MTPPPALKHFWKFIRFVRATCLLSSSSSSSQSQLSTRSSSSSARTGWTSWPRFWRSTCCLFFHGQINLRPFREFSSSPSSSFSSKYILENALYKTYLHIFVSYFPSKNTFFSKQFCYQLNKTLRLAIKAPISILQGSKKQKSSTLENEENSPDSGWSLLQWN